MLILSVGDHEKGPPEGGPKAVHILRVASKR